MGVLKGIFTALEWWNLTPDQSVFASREDPDKPSNMAARSRTGNWVMAYLSSPTEVSIRMDKITAGGVVGASWVDPRTGKQTEIGSFPNRGTRSFSTPDGWEDAVLLLESV